jgi:hypothetical protein
VRLAPGAPRVPRAPGQEASGAPDVPEVPRVRPGALEAPRGLACASQSPGRAVAGGRGSLVEAIWTPGCPDQPSGLPVVMAGSGHVEEWVLARS